MEAQFNKALFLVLGQGSEDLSGIQQMVLIDEFVDVECQQWQVQ